MRARRKIDVKARPARGWLRWRAGTARRRRTGDRRGAPAVTRLFILEPARLHGDPLATVATLPGGVDVLLRGYRMPNRPAFALELARICRRQGRRLLIAGDAALAARLRADGLHLGEEGAKGVAPRRRLMPGRLLSLAVHSRRALARSTRVRADLVLVSPVFPTRSHPAAPGLGPHRLARLIGRRGGWTQGPRILALGGVDPRRMRRLPPGLDGMAAIGGWLAEQSEDGGRRPAPR